MRRCVATSPSSYILHLHVARGVSHLQRCSRPKGVPAAIPTNPFSTARFFYRPSSEFKLGPIAGHPIASDSSLDTIVVHSQVSVGFGKIMQKMICEIMGGDNSLMFRQAEVTFYDSLYIDIGDIPFRTRTHFFK
jgi:hypothetical protein